MTDTGGPAFPTPIYSWDTNGEASLVDNKIGMTLRDYFASQSLAHASTAFVWIDGAADDYARRAYELADAMLKERSK
jgi:hypothetical protein